MRTFARAAAAAAVVATSLACTGLFGGGETTADPEVEEAMDELEGTALEARSGADPMFFDLKGGGAPTMSSGNGVQVVHVAPLGDGRKALQAAVVFDRPMVALADLDAMSDVPLQCSPEIPHRARWAGTTTAVWIPSDGSFPLAHEFTCSVPAGTPAIDSVTLENRIEWTFETERPKVRSVTPRDNATGIDPDSPITVRFNHPVSIDDIRAFVKLAPEGAGPIDIQLSGTEDPKVVEIRAELERDTDYKLTVDAGFVGQEGPLPSTEPFTSRFETYPPLTVTDSDPSGPVDPWSRIRFEFSTPVADREVAANLTISPEPDGWSLSEGEWASRYWSHSHGFTPRTSYQVVLSGDLEDQYGQKLGQDVKLEFTAGDYSPQIDVATGLLVYPAHNPTELPLKHLNTAEVYYKAAPVPLQKALREGRSKVYDNVDAAVATASQVAVETDDTPNQWEIDTFDLKPYAETGLVAVDVWSPQIRRSYGNHEIIHNKLMVLMASLGVTVKVGPDGTTAWVTSLETGEPVAGADVAFSMGGTDLGSAKTDADGIARVDGHPDKDWRRWQDRVLALATKGTDVGATYHDWADGIDPWRFDVYASWDHDGQDLTSWGFTDRGVYKRGEPVYASAHFRIEHAGGLKAVPDGDATWTLSNPEGGKIDEGTAKIVRGNVSVQTELPEDGQLGDYSLRITGDFGPDMSRTVYLSAPARAYREPAFRVSVHSDEGALQGEEITGHLDARYMFGAPLSSGEVTWRAWVDPTSFDPEGFDEYWFGPERRWWWEDSDPDEGLGTLSTHETTVAEGKDWTLAAPDGRDRPVTLNLEAEVTDVDRQTIANSTQLTVHPTTAYVGVRPLERMPIEGTESSFELVAVTPEGERAAAETTEVEVVKRTWKRTREKGVDGRWEYVSQVEETVVHSETQSVGGGPVTISWTPDGPGTFVLRATRVEGDRRQVAEDRIYVRGKGYASWGIDEENMLRLIPDKRVYHLGDTARILVQSPVPGLQALVTVEREGVLWSEVVELEGTATTVDIPIADAWLPNVYVSVVSVEGAPPQDSPDAGKPVVRVGMIDLAVDKEDARLKVAVTPDRDVYRPQDQVTIDLEVTNADGSPAANTDVVLYAVDEAVLSLTNYETPDPLTGLIHHRSLSALTGDSRTAVLDRAKYLTKGAEDGGGGGGESGPEIRENFVTTVAWKPDLRTDANGTVQASFELPDNLTAFRVMAVATTGDRFGSGDQEITVTRPIIARPALPRKLRVDDVAFAGVVVHNNTDSDVMADVSGTVETGPVDILGSPVLLKVPAHEAIEVPFRLKGTGIGEASFLFEVKAGKERDAIRWPLVVEEDVPLEVVATSGSTEGEVTEKIGQPRTNRPDLGGLSVDLGTTALAGAGSGLDYLLEYPHGCIEQTTSRGLGALMALRVREHAGLELDEDQLRAVVNAALMKLPDYRATREDGLGYWKGSWYASPMGTAYAVEFMGRAKAAGFDVDDKLLDEAVGYTKKVLNGKTRYNWDAIVSLQGKAYAALALARAGRGDAGHNSNLYAQRDNLTIASAAHVLEAIALTTGADGRTQALGKTLESRAYIDAASASIKENDTGRWARLWGSDDLSTAAALEALLVAEGEHVLAPKFALHLASSKTSGRWANTRATAGVLAALAAYADRYEQGGDDRTVTATLAGSELVSQAMAIPESNHTEIPLDQLEEGDLVVKAEGGRVYYEHRLAYAPVEMKARDEGFTVIREIEIVEGGGPDGEVQAGAMLAITLRVVTPVVRHDVAVVDAIPAGWEPLDSSLAGTSKAPDQQPDTSGDDEGGTDELPAFGGSWVYDHHEIDDIEVRLYADYMPPGIHTFRYAARATTPGNFGHPPARVEAMYQPEIFGRTSGGTMTVGRSPAVATNQE